MSEEIDLELATAKQVLFDVLGSTDPVKYHKAMSQALKHVEAAHVCCHEIEHICIEDAKRGPYSKD